MWEFSKYTYGRWHISITLAINILYALGVCVWVSVFSPIFSHNHIFFVSLLNMNFFFSFSFLFFSFLPLWHCYVSTLNLWKLLDIDLIAFSLPLPPSAFIRYLLCASVPVVGVWEWVRWKSFKELSISWSVLRCSKTFSVVGGFLGSKFLSLLSKD